MKFLLVLNQAKVLTVLLQLGNEYALQGIYLFICLLKTTLFLLCCFLEYAVPSTTTLSMLKTFRFAPTQIPHCKYFTPNGLKFPKHIGGPMEETFNIFLLSSFGLRSLSLGKKTVVER